MTQTIVLRVDVLLYSALLALVIVTALVVAAAAYLPPAVDWDNTYHPAASALVRLRSPYAADVGFYNPPWALLAVSPFIAGREAGRGAVFIVSLGAYALVAIRLGAKPVTVGLFLTSPPVVHSLLNGNLEWLVLLGVILPPRWGMFLILVKPQVAGGLVVYWVVETWRKGGWLNALKMLTPVTLVSSVSVLVFGLWPVRVRAVSGLWWNTSLWPYSIPVGIGLLVWGIWKREEKAALAASPFLAPYVLLHAWAGAVVAVAGQVKLMCFLMGKKDYLIG